MSLDDYLEASGPDRVAPDRVSAAMIRHWLQAMLFVDGATPAIQYGGHSTAEVAPLAMLQVWTHHDRRFRPDASEPNQIAVFEHALDAAGYTGVIGVASDQRYLRAVGVGERLTMRSRIGSISPPKQTRLGEGRFITFCYSYYDESGEQVGTIDMTSLRYVPAVPGGPAGAQDGSTLAADANGASASFPRIDPAELAPGAELPEATAPVTATTVVAGALATRDFHPVHHDLDYARRTGSESIILSIMTSLGLVERAVYGWLGDSSRMAAARLKLGSPCHPGDVLRFAGRVKELGPRGRLSLAVEASTLRGRHVSALVDLGE